MPNVPDAIFRFMLHLIFLDIDADFSCASPSSMDIIISSDTHRVSIPSFSKRTLIPRFFNSLKVLRHSLVLRANLLSDFVTILSSLPLRQSSIILINSVLSEIVVPLHISAYISTSSSFPEYLYCLLK